MNYVYILRCADDTLYSGWTNDLTRRLAAHNNAKTGAKYTRSRRPITLVHCEVFATQSEAMQRENAIKALSREQKEAIIRRTADTAGEHLEVLDTQGEVRGILPRTLVHRCGLRHRVAHLLVCQSIGGEYGVWLQQRGFDRPTLPGYYDWTATGHLTSGESPAAGAVREALEETGLKLPESAIIPAGVFHQKIERSPLHVEDELVQLYVYFTRSQPAFSVGAEVAQVAWTPCRCVSAAYRRGAELPLTLPDGAQDTASAALLSPLPGEWNKLSALCAGKG